MQRKFSWCSVAVQAADRIPPPTSGSRTVQERPLPDGQGRATSLNTVQSVRFTPDQRSRIRDDDGCVNSGVGPNQTAFGLGRDLYGRWFVRQNIDRLQRLRA